MKDFLITPERDGKKVIRIASNLFPNVNLLHFQRALKRKDIRVNGKRISRDQPVHTGDRVELWLPDAIFSGEKEIRTFGDPGYQIIFENRYLLIINKPQGFLVHSGKDAKEGNLIDIVRKNKEIKDPYDLDKDNVSEINLCHRLDRNTGGLILLSKNKDAHHDIMDLLTRKKITKRYRCLVKGIPNTGTPCLCADKTPMLEMSAFMEKSKNGIFLHDESLFSYLPVTTRYRVIQIFKEAGPENESISELEVELVTGRTHQIRVHLAHIGHPILGDGNYGRNRYNRFFKAKTGGFLTYQQLFSSKLCFGDIPAKNRISNLSGKSFSITPDYQILLSFLNSPCEEGFP